MIGFLLSTAAAAMSAASTLGYNSMAPRSQMFGRTFTGVNHDSRQLALTFDDGPNGLYTLRLLDVLKRHDVRATFFMIGRYVIRAPRVAREVVEQGHALGNHTFTHMNLIFASPVQIRRQLSDCASALREFTGQETNLFRPPHGGRRPGVLHVARDMGYEPIMWSVTAYDWQARSNDEVEAHVVRQVRGGDVILLHDGGHLNMSTDRSATVTATDNLIRRYKDEGYEFVTIPEMMATLPTGRDAELPPEVPSDLLPPQP